MPPPPRGRPYYDVASGRKMILPREGGKAVPYIEGTPPRFDARKTLRRTGLAARDEARSSARVATSFGRTFARETGVARIGAGELLVYMGFTLLGLALLDTALRGRGPAAVGALFDLAGSGIRRLFSTRDPLIGYSPPAGEGSSRPANTAGAAGGGSTRSTGGGVVGPGTSTTPSGRLVPLAATSGIRTDRGISELVAGIAKRFGVTPTSGYRSPTQNAAVGGASRSDHLCGLAVDFAGRSAAMARLARWAARQKFAFVAYDGVPETYYGGHADHVHISFNRC